MSSIFYNIEPKVINTELACEIGLNEAIVLQQLHYWLERNKESRTDFRDGRYWTYGTIQEYRDRDFKFWSFDTVKRTLHKLISLGFLVKGNYNRMKLDQTNWYTIDYAALDEWLRKNGSVKYRQPSGQNAPMDSGIRPMQQGNMPQWESADCPDPLGQNAPMEQGRLPHAIPEIKQTINNKRLTNKTNTQKDAPPPAGENVSATEAVVGEVVDACELLFNEFWKLYPRKESKQQAKKAWLKLKPDQALFDLIANALEYRRQTKE